MILNIDKDKGEISLVGFEADIISKKESLEYEALLTPSRCDHDDEVDICQFQTISTSSSSSHLDTARDKRLPDIKKENLEYESLLVPSRCCDDDNEVVID